jgi:DNA processing protein
VRAWAERQPWPPEVERALSELGSVDERQSRASALRRRCELLGHQVLLPTQPAYPRSLLALADPPAAIFARGDLTLLRQSLRVGVVGARRGTERGRRSSEEIGAALARAGVVVVSGLALGIDAASHRGCLAVGGRPVAVLATGCDRSHPRTHAALHREVAATGLLLSEYPPGSPPQPHRFIGRNRILAALSRKLVVVEAGVKSGALSTAEFAQQLNVDVLAVPGPVDCPHSRGTLQLLREGAGLVRHGRDVLDELGLFGVGTNPTTPLGLGDTPEHPEQIAQRLARPLGQVLVELADAELRGDIERLAGGRYRRALDSDHGLR